MRHSLNRFDMALYKEAGIDPLSALHSSGASGSATNKGTTEGTKKVKGKLSPLTIAALLLAGGGVGYGVRAYQDDRRMRRERGLP